MKKTVLVTGGAGFIGSHVVDTYIKSGFRVAVVDDLSTGKRSNINPKADFCELSILDDALPDVFKKVEPDIVNHLAAQASVRRSVEDPAFDAGINIIGSLRLLELARVHQVEKFIFSSTGGAIYGEPEYAPADEKHPVKPVSPYGCAKASVEIYLNYYHQAFGLAYTALRYANVYGPRQDPLGEAGVVAIFSRQLVKGEQSVINGDGRQTRDFVYVGDVAAANLIAGESDFIGSANISTGIETSVLELYNMLKKSAGVTAEPKFGPPLPGEQRRSVLDPSKAQKELDWRPKTTLAAGLKKTIDYFKNAESKVTHDD